MVSINTNLSSLIVQHNLMKSTNGLNQAIERLTTGFKINHASDNAANYSISTSYDSKLSSLEIAQDNIEMGMDMVATAGDMIAVLQSHAERIHNLITQAQNGTYGEDSQKAIVAEINARIAEIDRLYNIAEYNGISLFNSQKIDIPENALQPGESGFIDESALSGPVMVEETGFIRALSTGTVDGIKDSYTDAEIAAMTKVKTLTKFTAGQTYAVTDVEDLQKLAELQNSGVSTSNVTFVLGADLDLSGIDWNPIGDNNTSSNATRFRGTFNGNGHTISNLTVNNPDLSYQGLFGFVRGGKIRNLGLKNAEVSGNLYVGALVGSANNNVIVDNCYTESTVNSQGAYAGGIVGSCETSSSIKNSYSCSIVSALGANVGGLVGNSANSSVSNSYSVSTINGQKANAGGCIGRVLNSNISNCYSEGVVNGNTNAGGFIGASIGNSNINSCYSAGSVTGISNIGGFIGLTGAGDTTEGTTTINNSISLCTNIFGEEYIGSFVGGYCTQSYYPDDFKSSHGNKFIYNGGLSVTNCSSVSLDDIDIIGEVHIKQYKDEGYIDPNTGNWVSAKSFTYVKNETYDIASLLENIDEFYILSKPTSIQVGINGNDSSSISFDTNFMYNLSGITSGGIVNSRAFDIINNFLNKLSTKATQLGAVTNRLESAMESVTVDIENLTSSLSTIRDADIAKESSRYIKNQILQQASSTLLATANQTPSIALQLL